MSTLAIPAFRKRSMALAVAVVLAALATVALVSYVRGVENRALSGAQTVSVYVAKADIPANMSASEALSRGFIERQSVPRNLLVPGAITSLLSIEGKIASAAILQGEQIAQARFVAPSEAAGLAIPVPRGKQGFAVSVSAPKGVAGFIRPGNHVSLIGQFDLAGKAAQAQGIEGRKSVKYLVQNVLVLAVNRDVQATAVSASTGTKDDQKEAGAPLADSFLLTLALSPSDAEKVAFEAFGGENLWITLVNDGEAAAKTSGRDPLNILGR